MEVADDEHVVSERRSAMQLTFGTRGCAPSRTSGDICKVSQTSASPNKQGRAVSIHEAAQTSMQQEHPLVLELSTSGYWLSDDCI